MKELKVRLTFTEEMLGTASSDPEIHEKYIASKSPDAKTISDEVKAVGVEEVVEKSMTIFPKLEDGTPFIYDYQIRGFFKEACAALKAIKDKKSSGIKAFKKKVDNHVFVNPRKIVPEFPSAESGNCQRPLRASTPQGERVTLANSETLPAGTSIEFTVVCLVDEDVELVKEWLEYGEFKGLGQWRNSGKGRFTVEYLN